MDVRLPKEVSIKEGQSLTLDVTEAYLDAINIVSNGYDFTKLKIDVVKCNVVRIYPEEKKTKKSSKKVSK